MSLAAISFASIGAARARKKRAINRATSLGHLEHLQLTLGRRELEENALQAYDESAEAYDLLHAVEEDDVDGIEAAIAAGAPLNARLRYSEFPGQTPLVCAVRLAKTRCFTMLVQLGADPFIPDDKYRDAWYYCAFCRNLKDGEHKAYMELLLEAWTVDGKVMLLAMHSQHTGVRLAALQALPVEITSRDSKNHCRLRLQNLGSLDDICSRSRLRFPDGSCSRKGLTPFQKMVESGAVESVAQPAVLALMRVKWLSFARICFLLDIFTYLMTLVSISVVALLYPFNTSTEALGSGDFHYAQIFNLFANGLMLVQEAVMSVPICLDQRSFWPFFGRPLHAFISCSLAFLFKIMCTAGEENIIAAGDVLGAAVVFTWMRMLYFIRLSKGFGSFCIILVEMIKRDVTKFLILLAGILPGFVIAMHMMILLNCDVDDMADYAGERWLSPLKLTANMIFMMIGVLSWDSPLYECLDRTTLTFVVMLFLLMTAIVLLNLMIAMFSDTYERIQTQAVHQWAYNIAVYIRDKELLMRFLRVPDSVVHLGGQLHGWLYTCEGRYNDYFIPQLRGEVDDRPEDYILEQLEEMWQDIQTRQTRLEDQIRSLHKHLLPNEVVAQATTGTVAQKNTSSQDD